jgi:predicted N-formylglutamate amidohydrolase
LIDFFHVNTDAGAPELGMAIAEQLGNAVIIRCRIPRTFIDCNRRIDASLADFKAGKVTPGLMPWITTDHDRQLLRGLYDQYVGTVKATLDANPAAALLMLHTYAPRSVEIEVGPDIGPKLRAAYQPDVEPTWKMRPEIDVISKDLDGKSYAPPAVLAALKAGLDLPVAESETYPMHPSTLAYDHVIARPGKAICVEVRRDLLADPFTPFAQMTIGAHKVARLAGPFADAMRRF